MERVAWFGLDLHAHRMMFAKEKYLALEESGSGRWVAQVAKPHVTEVIVCDPRVNYHISRHHHKCDIEDAYRAVCRSTAST